MKSLLSDPGLRFSAPSQSGEVALAEQVQRLLETRPGTLPWRPHYGCDLAGLLGRPSAASLMVEARFRVEQAIHRWIPGVRVRRCEIRNVVGGGAAARMPAERAMTRMGAGAALWIDLEIETVDGRVPLSATVRP